MSTSEKSLLPRRPSLYAAITLARLVQRVRQHLKARVKTHKSVAKQPSIDRNADVHGYIQLSRSVTVGVTTACHHAKLRQGIEGQSQRGQSRVILWTAYIT